MKNSAECKKPKGAQLAALVSNPPGAAGIVPVDLSSNQDITCSCGNTTAKYLFAPGIGDPNLATRSVEFTLPATGSEPLCHNLCIKAKGKGRKHVYYTSPNSSSVPSVQIFAYCPTDKSCANYAVLRCGGSSVRPGDGLVDKKGKVVWSCAQQGLIGLSAPNLTTKGYIKPVAISCDGGCGALKKKGKQSQVKKCKKL